MTAEDLRAIITPAVESDLKAAGLWPTRDVRSLRCDDEGHDVSWHWVRDHPQYILCHPDDAHAQIERRLVEWALDQGYAFIVGTGYYMVTFDAEREAFHPTLLHALLAAFAGRVK